MPYTVERGRRSRKSATASTKRCPGCGTPLESGYLSFGGGLLWHDQPLRGWRRLFVNAYQTGRLITGSYLSSGLLYSIEALRCNRCGAVLAFPEGP